MRKYGLIIFLLTLFFGTFFLWESSNASASEIILHVPPVVSPGDIVTVNGSGADPNETIVLQATFQKDISADQSFRIGVFGYRYSFSDVYPFTVTPAKDVFVGWQRLPEQSGTSPKDYIDSAYSNNPTYMELTNTESSLAIKSSPGTVSSHRGVIFVTCGPRREPGSNFPRLRTMSLDPRYRFVMGGTALGDVVKGTLEINRFCRSDANGNFSTSIELPKTKLLEGTHIVTAFGTNKKVTSNITVNTSKIGNEPPIAFIFAPYLFNNSWQVETGKLVAFDGNYSVDNDGEIVSYLWDFGDGSIAKGAVVDHVYNEPGVKDVSLVVTDNLGAENNMMIRIKTIKRIVPVPLGSIGLPSKSIRAFAIP